MDVLTPIASTNVLLDDEKMPVRKGSSVEPVQVKGKESEVQDGHGMPLPHVDTDFDTVNTSNTSSNT